MATREFEARINSSDTMVGCGSHDTPHTADFGGFGVLGQGEFGSTVEQKQASQKREQPSINSRRVSRTICIHRLKYSVLKYLGTKAHESM